MLAPFSPLSPSALLAQMHFRDNGNKDNENWVKKGRQEFCCWWIHNDRAAWPRFVLNSDHGDLVKQESKL